MNNEKTASNMVTFIGYFMLLSVIALGFYDSTLPSKEVNVPCYDRYHNEIQGLTCINDESYIEDFLPILIICSLVLIFTGYGLRVLD